MESLIYWIYGATRLSDVKEQLGLFLFFGLAIFVVSTVIRFLVQIMMTKENREEVQIFEAASMNCREVLGQNIGFRYILQVMLGVQKMQGANDLDPKHAKIPTYSEKLAALNSVREQQGLPKITPTNQAFLVSTVTKYMSTMRMLSLVMMLFGSISLVVPTTRDAVVIASSYGLTKAVQNETVQKTFEKSVAVVEVWLDKLNVEPASTPTKEVAPAKKEEASAASAEKAVKAAESAASASAGAASQATAALSAAVELKKQIGALLDK